MSRASRLIGRRSLTRLAHTRASAPPVMRERDLLISISTWPLPSCAPAPVSASLTKKRSTSDRPRGGAAPAGFAVLDPAALAATDRETAVRLLSRVVGCLGGARYPARGARLARLGAALVQEPRHARTLGGCRFVPWRGRLLVLRELAAAEAPKVLEPGADLLWDRRFAVRLSPDAAGAVDSGTSVNTPSRHPMADQGKYCHR